MAVLRFLVGELGRALRSCVTAIHARVPEWTRWFRKCAPLSLVLTLSGASVHAADGSLVLYRGVNIQGWLNQAPLTANGESRWPPYLDLEEWGSRNDLKQIKALGFDFVRLIVDPGPLLAAKDEGSGEAVIRLERAARTVTEQGLKVVLDLHHDAKAWSAEEIKVSPDAMARYRSSVSSLARRLARIGTDKVALELMDAPQVKPCDGSHSRAWDAALGELVGGARAAAPDLTLVVSGACGSITSLVQLDPENLGTSNVLFSFNFFEPQRFTRQGQSGARDVKGAPWPMNDTEVALALVYSELLLDEEVLSPEQRAIRSAKIRSYLDAYVAEGGSQKQLDARFEEVRAWAERYGVPRHNLLLGAFGAMAANDWHGGALDAHRFFWLDAVRREAGALGAAWAYWEYSSPDGMSLTSPDRDRIPDRIALEALGLLGGKQTQSTRINRAQAGQRARQLREMR